jgi:transcriptional regulator with XRE-family HTH domain
MRYIHNMRLGEYVRSRRAYLGLKQSELAERVSRHANLIGQIEKNLVKINLADFDAWVRALELPDTERDNFYALCYHAKRPDQPIPSTPSPLNQPVSPPALPASLAACIRQTRALVLKAHLTVAYTYGVIPGGAPELIRRAGITPAQYNAWVQGREGQDPVALDKMAAVLKTSIAFLLESDGPLPEWYRIPPLIADETGSPLQPIDAVYADLRQNCGTPHTDHGHTPATPPVPAPAPAPDAAPTPESSVQSVSGPTHPSTEPAVAAVKAQSPHASNATCAHPARHRKRGPQT